MTTPTGLDRITRRPQRTDKVCFALDPNDAVALSKARQAVAAAAAKAAQKPGDETLQYAALEAEERLAEHIDGTVTFTVHLSAIGAAAAEDLVRRHAPTKEQRAKARAAAGGDPKAEPAVNELTYPGAILAEAIDRIVFSDGETVDGPLGEDQATDLYRSLSGTDRILLLSTAESLDIAATRLEDLGNG